MIFAICFHEIILVSYSGSRFNRVNPDWLRVFFIIFFFSILPFIIWFLYNMTSIVFLSVRVSTSQVDYQIVIVNSVVEL